jgi:endonuclease/exonuclease/phosphatase family metal-dependent hydrolase
VRIIAANLNGNAQAYQPFAIRIFQGVKPDVVAVQEFNYGNNTPEDIRSMLDTAFGTNFTYFRETNSGYSIPNGVISRYPIAAAGSWVDAVQSQPNRGFAWAQITLPGTNELYLVSVHLLSSAGATARAEEAANLRALIQTSFPSNAWIVIAGDLNTDSRTETAMVTFGSFLSDNPIPTDAVSGGNPDTSVNRNHPYDYVLPSFSLTNLLTAAVFASHSFSNGLVFDSRVYTPLEDAAPVLYGDSSNAQHMAVLKDFLIPVSGTNYAGIAPSITVQPQNLAIVQGSTAVFGVIANGTAPLAYQWFFDGASLSGATTNSMTIANAKTANAGSYSVVVTNAAGSTTSAVATLTVVTSPVITIQPTNQSVMQGSTAGFTVGCIGIQPLSYQWFFNGIGLPGATNDTLAFASAQLTDAGSYTVVVTNVAGSSTSAVVILTVNPAVTGAVTTLAGWDVSGQTNYGSSPLPPTTNAPNVTIAGLSRESGLTTNNTAASRAWGGNSFNSASAEAAVAAGQYVFFSISPKAGWTVSFTSVNKFDYRRSGTGPPNGVLQYQIGSGGFTNIAALAYPSTANSGASLSAIDLSGIPGLQNVRPDDTVTLRILNYGASGSGGNWYIYDVGASTAPDFAIQGILNRVPAPTNSPAAPALLSVPAYTNDQFQFLLTGTAGSNYVVEGSDDPGAVNWISLLTNSSPFTFKDTNASPFTQRFYRALSLP